MICRTRRNPLDELRPFTLSSSCLACFYPSADPVLKGSKRSSVVGSLQQQEESGEHRGLSLGAERRRHEGKEGKGDRRSSHLSSMNSSLASAFDPQVLAAHSQLHRSALIKILNDLQPTLLRDPPSAKTRFAPRSFLLS